MKSSPTNSPVVGGGWQDRGLNKHLVVKIRPVIEGNFEGGQGNQTYEIDATQPIVASLFEDADFAIESQYSTPFESANPEGRLPNLMGMIQSGQINAAYGSFFAANADPTGIAAATIEAGTFIGETTGVSGAFSESISNIEGQLQGLLGRSNFTKLNSRQIYTSSNSIRISGSLIFQAWSDAKAEVEDALQLLQGWSSAVSLSDKSLVVGAVTDGFSEAMFPSTIPRLVQLQYGGKTYKPLVIESVSAPITAPMNEDGSRIAVRVQITLLSLTAWDEGDIINTRR